MDFVKTQKLLDKINRLHKTIALDPENIEDIERDLMLSYIQQLYAKYKFNTPAIPQVQTPTYTEKPIERPAVVEPTFQQPRPKEANLQKEPSHLSHLAEEERQALEQLKRYAPSEESRRNPKIVTTTTVEKPPIPKVVKEVKKEPITTVYKVQSNNTPKEPEELNKIFESNKVSDLSDKLRQSPISDLTKAMGINEKILTINELFNGDQRAFDMALSKLNSFSNYSEAQDFMSSNLTQKYNWVASKEKQVKAQKFVNLVKRRYS